MTVKYHLCGYDRSTDFLGVDIDIPPDTLPIVRALLPEAADDPEFIDPLTITDREAVLVAAVLGVPVEPDRFAYFIESDEDAHVVAAQVEAMRAKA
jgi:hypothetical protein